MATGDPGQVVAAQATWEVLGGRADGLNLGPTRVKGKHEPVEAWILRSLS